MRPFRLVKLVDIGKAHLDVATPTWNQFTFLRLSMGQTCDATKWMATTFLTGLIGLWLFLFCCEELWCTTGSVCNCWESRETWRERASGREKEREREGGGYAILCAVEHIPCHVCVFLFVFRVYYLKKLPFCEFASHSGAISCGFACRRCIDAAAAHDLPGYQPRCHQLQCGHHCVWSANAVASCNGPMAAGS